MTIHFANANLWMGVLVSTLCGFIIGAEREMKNKPAGLRSIILISVGCSLLTSLSYEISVVSSLVDPTRMISQIITGIGFLGGGAILKHEDKVLGITTAAFVWIASCMGIMAGMGMVLEPIALTIGLVVMSVLMEKTEKWFSKRRGS
jgi:putative Mg2+ transporter-C (MgtC) family protein